MKKKLILGILLLGVSLLTFAQIRKVPAEVTNALKEKYPAATDVSWKDNLADWEASFTNNGTNTTAYFSNKGEWKETQAETSFDALPQAVKDGFSKSKYNDWTTGSVKAITRKGKELQYRIYVEKSSLVQKKYLYFNEKGVLRRDAQTL